MSKKTNEELNTDKLTNEEIINEENVNEEIIDKKILTVKKEGLKLAGNNENAVVETAIKRSQYANMMKIGDTYIRMGKGISEYRKSLNGEKEEYQWIHEDSPTKEVDHYAPSFDGTLKCYKNEPLFEYLFPLYKKLATQTDAHVMVADVYIFDKNEDGTYPATESDATITFKEYAGNELTFDIDLNGDPVDGKMTIDTNGKGTFAKTTE